MKKSGAKMLGRGPARGRPKPMAPLNSTPLGARRESVQRFTPVVESGSAEVEESFHLRPPSPGRKMAFAMTMKMSAKLMEVLLQAEQNGVQPEIKFGIANVIKVGDMEFKLTSNPEAGSGLCDCYMDEQQTSNGAEGALIHVGSVDRKLSVQRLLDDSEREKWKGRSDAVDKAQKGRRVMVLDTKNQGLDGSSQSQNIKKRKPSAMSSAPPATRPKLMPINKPISRPIPSSRPPPAPTVTLSQAQKTTREPPPPVVPVATPPPLPPVVTPTLPSVSVPALPPRIGGKEKVVSPASGANSPAENGASQGKTLSSQAPINLTELRLTIIRILKQNPKGMKPKALEKAVGREFHQMERTLKQIAEYKAPGLWRLQNSIPTPPSVGTSSPDSLVESPPTPPEPANTQEQNGKPGGVADLSNNVAKLPTSRINSGATHPMEGGHGTKSSPKGQEDIAVRSESRPQSLGDRQKMSKPGNDSNGGRVLSTGQNQENFEHHPPKEKVKPVGIEVNEKTKTVRTSNKRQNSETQLKSPEQISKVPDTTGEGNAGQEESGDESASSGGTGSDSDSESGSESGSESSGTSGSESESEGSSSSSGEEDEESMDINIDSDGEAKAPMLASDGTDGKLTQENKEELKLSRSESEDGRTVESDQKVRESKREKHDGERMQHKHKDHKDGSSKVDEELHSVDGLKDRGAAVASGFETIDIGVEEEVDVDDGVEDSSIPGALQETFGLTKSEGKEPAQNTGGSSMKKAEKESNREKRRAERALGNERPEKREKIDRGELPEKMESCEPIERTEKAKSVKLPKRERGEKGEREPKRKERHGNQDLENTRLLKGDEAGIVEREKLEPFETREGVDIVESETALDGMGETQSMSSGPVALEKGESPLNEGTAVNQDGSRQEILIGKAEFSERVEEHGPANQAKDTLGEGERLPTSGPIAEAQRTGGKATKQASSYEHQSDNGEEEGDEEREDGELESDEEAESGENMNGVHDGKEKMDWKNGDIEGRMVHEELRGNENRHKVETKQQDEQGSQKVNQTFVEEEKRPNESEQEWESEAEHDRSLTREERKQIEKQRLEQDEIEKDRERKEKERIERDRIERARLEKERTERELEKERKEAEKRAKERMARELEENERKDRERKAKEREEKEKMEKERMEKERRERNEEKEKIENERKERIEKERKERIENERKERIENDRKERERQERLRREREREEKLRIERDRVEKERLEREIKEKEREDREQKLREKKEKEKQERDKREKDREDRERQAQEREKKEQKEREEKEQKEKAEFQRSRRDQEKTKERTKQGGHVYGTDGRFKMGVSSEIGEQEDLDADQEGSVGRRFSQAKGSERILKGRGTEEDNNQTSMEKEGVVAKSSKNYQVGHEIDRSSSEAGEDEERVKKNQMGSTLAVKRAGEEATRVHENLAKRKFTADVAKPTNQKQSPARIGTGSRHTSPLPPIVRAGSLTSQSVGSPSEGRQTPVRREKVRSINAVVRKDDIGDAALKGVSRNKDASPLKERSVAPKQENVGGRETRGGRAEVGGGRLAEIQTNFVTGSRKSGQRGNSMEMTQVSDEEENAPALHETSPKVVASNPSSKTDGFVRKLGSQAGEYAGAKPVTKGPVLNGGNKEGGPLGTAKKEDTLPVMQGGKLNGQKRSKDDFFAKFEKEKADLKGPLNSVEQCLEYEKEFHEKFCVYKLLNDTLETDRDEFLAIRKGLQKEDDEEERKIKHAKLKKKYKQMNPRHSRMLAVFTVLHTELQVIKRRITDFVHVNDRS